MPVDNEKEKELARGGNQAVSQRFQSAASETEVLSATAPETVSLRVGDRVWLNEDVEQHNRIVVGTVKTVSQCGYVRVWWDEVYPVSHFSPTSAQTRLRVVSGDDALPRHDWDCQKDQTDPPCLRCGAIQTDANEHEPCRSSHIQSSATE